MHIEGKCHCGNITYVLRWPGEGTNIPVRACSCRFCTKHGGTYTSHRDAGLAAIVHDEAPVSRYVFGTETAEFYLCSRCGVVPFVTSMIEDNLYPVVNVNSFEGIDPACFLRAVTDFDGETTESRLDRRKRNWIPSVTITSWGEDRAPLRVGHQGASSSMRQALFRRVRCRRGQRLDRR